MKKKLHDMTEEELYEAIRVNEQRRDKARYVFLAGLVLKIIVLITLLFLHACADILRNPPVGIWEDGMRMPTDQACYMDTENGQTVLRACK